VKLSVVVPLFNEEENVGELHRRIVASLDRSEYSFEMIFVDDGSRDRTFAVLREIAEADPKVRAVKLRRNYGQTPGMRAGIDLARGEVIVTMDGDLQNDPADIPAMVRKLEEGFDLVAGWRKNRKDPVLHRTLPSKIANWLIGKVTGVPIHDNGCSLKVFRAQMILATPLYSEMHRFIPAMITAGGGRIAEVVVNHHPRLHGTSKYGLSRTGKVLLDLFTVKMLIAFSQRPLQWFAVLALPFALLSLAAAGYFLVLLAVRADPEPTVVFPSVSVLFAYLALHLLMLGFVGELIVRTGNPFRFRSMSQVWNSGTVVQLRGEPSP
jgi:glycosyltransferase involved in cell wall biosynthesis